MTSEEFAGRVVAVTGAASGIGAACAMKAARAGANVIMVDIDSDGVNQNADAVRGSGGNAHAIAADLGERKDLADLGQKLVSFRVDCLINAAGLFGPAYDMRVSDTQPEIWRQLLEVNLNAPMELARALLPAMTHAQHGSFVQIASLAGLGAFPKAAAYTMSKAALLGFTRSIAVDYGELGIRSNAVIPGAIETPGVLRLFAGESEMRETAAAHNPMRRIGTANEVAEAALFLASDRASYINGSFLVVDGGRHAVS